MGSMQDLNSGVRSSEPEVARLKLWLRWCLMILIVIVHVALRKRSISLYRTPSGLLLYHV